MPPNRTSTEDSSQTAQDRRIPDSPISTRSRRTGALGGRRSRSTRTLLILSLSQDRPRSPVPGRYRHQFRSVLASGTLARMANTSPCANIAACCPAMVTYTPSGLGTRPTDRWRAPVLAPWSSACPPWRLPVMPTYFVAYFSRRCRIHQRPRRPHFGRSVHSACI